MALSTREKKDLRDALADQVGSPSQLTEKLTSAVDSQEAAAAVAVIGSTANLTALSPGATSHTALVISAFTATAAGLSTADTYTDAAVNTEIDTVLDSVETGMDLKADNADVETLRGEIETAMDLKADNDDAETLRTEVEARLDTIEAKVDALLVALNN